MTKAAMLVVGNWKMNGTVAEATQFADELIGGIACRPSTHDLIVCPPATLIAPLVARFSQTSVRIGAQDCHPGVTGAHTGDISAFLLADCGVSAIIVGHSERRADHGEIDALVRSKAEAVHAAGLIAIICVGETLDQRRAGDALSVIERQLRASLPPTADARNTVVAYEPVWAIGSGLTPSVAEIAEVHGSISQILRDIAPALADTRLLYGGSVKPSNAGEILAIADVNGVLVGGASLKAADFLGIAASAPIL